MSDTVRTLPARNKPFFSRSFDYSDSMVTDTASVKDSPSVPESRSFIIKQNTHGTNSNEFIEAASPDWIFWALLGAFLLLAGVKFRYEKRFKMVLASIFSKNTANQLIRESGIVNSPTFLYYFAIFIIVSIVFIYQVINYYSADNEIFTNHFLIYLKILSAYLGLALFKFILIFLAGLLFKNPETANENIQNIILFNLTGSMVLLPLLVLVHYSSTTLFLYISFSVIALLLIIRVLRSFLIGLGDRRFSLFHLFLYLCTLEILPVIVVAKFIDKYFFS
jgi:hypothetical protein